MSLGSDKEEKEKELEYLNKIRQDTLKYSFDRTQCDLRSYFDFLQSYYRGSFAINGGLAVIGLQFMKGASGGFEASLLYLSAIALSVLGATASAWGVRLKAKEQFKNYTIWERKTRQIISNFDASPSEMMDVLDYDFNKNDVVEANLSNALEKRLSTISFICILYSISVIAFASFIK